MTIYKYDALVYKQRLTANQFYCVFTAKVGEVNLWARVDRLSPDNKTGVQRQKKDSRVEAVARFLKADDRNTIPTSIVVALPLDAISVSGSPPADVGIISSVKKVEIKVDEILGRPGLIIDGQHRTLGMSQFDPGMPVNIVAIIGAPDEEIAFQFLVINNKVSKVSPDHIKALKLVYMDSQLGARLTKSARIKTTGTPAHLDIIDSDEFSPFIGMVRWPRNEVDPKKNRTIPSNAFEASLLYIAGKRIDSGQSEELTNPDFVVDFFLAIWRVVKEKWPDLWSDSSSKLLSKVGIIALTRYIVNTVVIWADGPGGGNDLSDLDSIEPMVTFILERQEAAFWTTEWDASGLDTRAGWDLVIQSLERISTNKKHNLPWNDGLTLAKSAGLSGTDN